MRLIDYPRQLCQLGPGGFIQHLGAASAASPGHDEQGMYDEDVGVNTPVKILDFMNLLKGERVGALDVWERIRV